jgi:tRNA pseudouridine65 synthase
MPLPLSLSVLHADDALAVVDKPAGLMVHDSALARGETDFAADRLREQFGKPIFLVHRLDRATSGCLLLAFDRDTASALGKMMMSREVGRAAAENAASGNAVFEGAAFETAAFEKDYWAVCRGWPEQSFVVDHDLDGGPGKPVKKAAVTRFTRLATTELALPSAGFETSRYALLCAQPQTGRFRQIRRHLKHVFHHLIGDTSHGDGRHNRQFRMLGVHRMLLHAQRLAFVHPGTGERLDVTAPVDAEFARALALFDAAPVA